MRAEMSVLAESHLDTTYKAVRVAQMLNAAFLLELAGHITEIRRR